MTTDIKAQVIRALINLRTLIRAFISSALIINLIRILMIRALINEMKTRMIRALLIRALINLIRAIILRALIVLIRAENKSSHNKMQHLLEIYAEVSVHH